MRALTLVLAIAGVLGLALAPAVGAAGSPFSGTWISIDDGDGSTQLLTVGRGSTPAAPYQDFYASTCDNAGSPTTHFVATGRGTVDDGSMWVDFRNGGCGRTGIGAFGLGFWYDAGTDTITDDFGITWSRFPR